MDLNTYLNTHETATQFSERLGVPLPSVSNWRHGKRPIPIEWMVVIEKESNGMVTRKDLCDKWQEIWPELARVDDESNESCACQS